MNNNIIITSLYYIVIIIVILLLLPFQNVLAEDLNDTNVRKLVSEEIRNFFLNIIEQNVTNRQTGTFSEVVVDKFNDIKTFGKISTEVIEKLPDISSVSYSNNGNILKCYYQSLSSLLQFNFKTYFWNVNISMISQNYYYENMVEWDTAN